MLQSALQIKRQLGEGGTPMQSPPPPEGDKMPRTPSAGRTSSVASAPEEALVQWNPQMEADQKACDAWGCDQLDVHDLGWASVGAALPGSAACEP